ncbi:Cdc25 family phosphatase Ibp1 [Schizosaccharomyces japonicus yFS275]|uniref:Cdc25 family phosphatase Ibp1 n=1 Tax=Schizosaccharomyces japonicus (strain yFS275 / FY16936) TaxID=402676 RepID=B6K637_SCHJY|nr:Cdc25 family phosphatase Ibp1 [Schizosaccharomyces japonicus yFS275]EEB08991.1 Cdc25 family phosphatase Ibp1 [Schizosaccharomyces japonicus yFS275]
MRNISYLSAETLKEWILEKPFNFVILDVRGEDRADGHIPGSINVPSDTFLVDIEKVMDQCLRAKCVIVHCTMSQIRGPKAARVLHELLMNRFCKGTQDSMSPIEIDEVLHKMPSIYILEGGFFYWNQRYCNDKRLVSYKMN